MRVFFCFLFVITQSVLQSQVPNLDSLRGIRNPKHNDLIYVKGHSSVRDGGEGFFFYNDSLDLGDDDGGIIIKPKWKSNESKGRWVRHLDGHINVNYFGVNAITARLKSKKDWSVSDTIQKAIDFASKNSPYDGGYLNKEVTKGNTVFFPNGQYFLNKPLILKDGVSIKGEEKTYFSAIDNPDYKYMIKMDSLRIRTSVENILLNGRFQGEVGGMLLESVRGGRDNDGGLWSSRFKNIKIVNINGDGIYLKGGDASSNYRIPNQFNIFENISINRANDEKKCLKMTGQNGQQTFINCLFEGRRQGDVNSGENVLIESERSYSTSSVISFINCTFQLCEYGVIIRNAHNITFDNCWFENLHYGIRADNSLKINILNSRFSNASGFGTLPFSERFSETGSCIVSNNSSINVEKNYVNVTNRNDPLLENKYFIRGLGTNNTIIVRDNEFQDQKLSKSVGVMQYVEIDNDKNMVDLGGKKQVCVNFSTDGKNANKDIRVINSTAGSGEIIAICANNVSGSKGKLMIHAYTDVFGENIFLGGRKSIVLSNGEWASFIKVDVPVEITGVSSTYQLISRSN